MTSPDRTEHSALVVVGAGPAGLAAAVTAADRGVPTILLDGAPRIGGQFWRHGPAGPAADADLHHDLAGFGELAARAAGLAALGRLAIRTGRQVWTLTVDADGATVYALDRRDPGAPRTESVRADYLVLAVGAYDRPLPFPGWELPGVLTVGAAQALLKGSGVRIGPRVLIAGTGPFLLPVATGLARRGARVVGVHEANRPRTWLAHPRAALSQPSKLAEAAGYAGQLARHRIRVSTGSVVVAAHGREHVTAVTVARVDRAGGLRPGTQRRIAVDALAIGYGFTSQSELALLAGVTMRPTVDGTLAVVTDERQATSHPRVFAAGELTGVGGAAKAGVEGRIAGAAVAATIHPGSGQAPDAKAARTRDRLRRFAAAMHAVYPVPTTWLETLEPDTIVCRCEEVTAGEIEAALDAGATDARSVKLLSRAGMGWCQGRECAYPTAAIAARRTGRPADPASGAERPIATPVPLGLLAADDPLPAPD